MTETIIITDEVVIKFVVIFFASFFCFAFFSSLRILFRSYSFFRRWCRSGFLRSYFNNRSFFCFQIFFRFSSNNRFFSFWLFHRSFDFRLLRCLCRSWSGLFLYNSFWSRSRFFRSWLCRSFRWGFFNCFCCGFYSRLLFYDFCHIST
ncbi:hypothetical protein D3C72_1875410 [compost metagenome]